MHALYAHCNFYIYEFEILICTFSYVKEKEETNSCDIMISFKYGLYPLTSDI